MNQRERFERFYRKWVSAQTAVNLTALAVVLSSLLWNGPLNPGAGALLLAVWGGCAMGALLVAGVRLERATSDSDGTRGRRLRLVLLVHAVTVVRSLAAVSVLVLVGLHGGRLATDNALGVGPFLLTSRTAWILFLSLALAETSDFIDGRLGRRFAGAQTSGRTPGRTSPPDAVASSFGSIWDMENDAFYALALSYGAWQIGGIPAVVLIIGVMRYFYFLLVRAEGDPPGDHRGYKLFARSTTATLMMALIAVYLPVLPHAVRGAFVYCALGMQMISFSWDLVLRARSGTLAGPAATALVERRRG